MSTDFKQQIYEIFGTTEPEQLRHIAKNADLYTHMMSTVSVNKSSAGRKNSFTDPQIAHILALQLQGTKIAAIARMYQVSRQTIYSQIKRAHHFSKHPATQMRMFFMNRDHLCTSIDIDFKHEQIFIQNYTDQIPLRAFGVITKPDWNDFEYFLEDRCFPKTRHHAKEILRDLGVPFYDPLLIIEKTQGRMEGDHQWIIILHRED